MRKGKRMMAPDIDPRDARLALGSIEQRRRQVLAEVGLPTWYWWGLALGWVGLGILADLGWAWVTLAATLVFGASHSAVAQHVLTGRHGSHRLSVRADLVSRRIPVVVFGCLLALVVVTVGVALVLNADGARHPATIAGSFVAVVVLLGGPSLMSTMRRRAQAEQQREAH
jgi:hypothetical protein